MKTQSRRLRTPAATAGLAGLALLFLLSSAGCSRCGGSGPAGGGAKPQSGGTLVVGLKAEPDALNVYLARTLEASYVANRVLPRIAREVLPDAGKPGGFEPELARKWEWSDEHRTLTLHLSAGGQWTDGTPVSCADLQFTLQAQKDPAVAWGEAEIKRHITGIECPDPGTAIVRFDAVSPTQFMDLNDLNVLPASAAAIPFAEWRKTDWAARLAWGGPFRVARAAAGEEVVLAKHDRWFGGKDLPHLDQIVLRAVPDPVARVTGLLSGELDVAVDIPADDVARVSAAPNLRVERRPSWIYTYLGWSAVDPAAYTAYREGLARKCAATPDDCPEDEAQLAALSAQHPHPLFGDARVRRALTMAIDRQALVDTLLQGDGEVPSSPLLSPLPEHDATLPAWPVDRARAQSLLKEAGWADTNGDGTLDKGGRPFSFKLVVQAGNTTRRNAAAMVQADLKKVGIDVQIEPVENSNFQKTLAGRGIDAWIGGWAAPSRVEMTALLHAKACGAQGRNYGCWSQAQADALALAARDTVDDTARYKAWHDWEKIFHQEQPYTLLYRPRVLIGVNARVHGTGSLTANDILSGCETWWVEPAARR